MYECLSGVLPFAQGTHDRSKVMYAVVHNAPKPLIEAAVFGEVTKGMCDFVGLALEKDQQSRYPTAAEMAGDLRGKMNPQPQRDFGMFISYRVQADKVFAQNLYQKATALRHGEQQMVVYLDQMEIRDGDRFGLNFVRGLAGSTIFVPLISAGCVRNMLELGGGDDKEDFVLCEWILALELIKRGQQLERQKLASPRGGGSSGGGGGSSSAAVELSDDDDGGDQKGVKGARAVSRRSGGGASMQPPAGAVVIDLE